MKILHKLNRGEVPEELMSLIPLAERFGATIPSEFDLVHSSISDSELREIAETLDGKHALIENWFYELYESNTSSPIELSALKGLVQIESELLDGIGFSGYLKWALRKYYECSDSSAVLRVSKALKSMDDLPKGLRRAIANQIVEAEDILNGGNYR